MNKKAKRIDTLKLKHEQIKAQIQVLEASKKSRERKRETRRKTLVGAYYLEKARGDNKFEELTLLMQDYQQRNSDRVLFDLEKIP